MDYVIAIALAVVTYLVLGRLIDWCKARKGQHKEEQPDGNNAG